jgi:hypothetical protein
MKTNNKFSWNWNQIVKLIPFALITSGFISCHPEVIDPDPPDNTAGPAKLLVTYWSDNESSGLNYYESLELSSVPGTCIFNERDMGQWQCMVGVQAGPFQYLVGHSIWSNEYCIRLVENSGVVKDFTDRGTWNNSYECFVGFHVGDRGFIFGQDTDGDHYWFVQQINQNGTMGNETDTGDWHNTYTCVPLYVGTETYLFFLEGGDKYNGGYWFISHVSYDGVLHDIDSGNFSIKFDALASCNVNGNTYLITWSNKTTDGSFFVITRINSNGTMGSQAGDFDSNLRAGHMVGYESGANGYFMAQGNGTTEYFIRQLNTDGKPGTITYSAYLAKDFMQLVPLNLNPPGNFRYQIGWDLAKSSGSPASWSPMYAEPWTSQAGFGGGAALGKINNDDYYDALFAGVQNSGSGKQFYYQIAWSLDNTGKPSGWSPTMYGPYVGTKVAGAGADIGDIDGNGIPDLALMVVDDPDGANSFIYRIGWNLDATGMPVSWADGIRLPWLGWENSGGGMALGDLDGNGRPEMVFMAIDNPAGPNHVWYTVVQLEQNGQPKSFTSMLQTPFALGDFSAGGGAALADIDGNGKLDFVVVNIDSPQGANSFWGQIGWDIDINGKVSRWTTFTAPSIGNITSGGGAAIGDIDMDGIVDLLLMALDNPYGKD